MGLIHLIRHGEPAVSGVLLGRLDPPLVRPPTPLELRVDTVFSSPLRRAKDTASALFPNHVVLVVDDLTEVSLGEWDGLTWSEIELRDPALAAMKLSDWVGVTAPGGESYAAILARAGAALDAIRKATKPVAVVAHVGINAALSHLLAGCSMTDFRQHYLEVRTYECTG